MGFPRLVQGVWRSFDLREVINGASPSAAHTVVLWHILVTLAQHGNFVFLRSCALNGAEECYKCNPGYTLTSTFGHLICLGKHIVLVLVQCA